MSLVNRLAGLNDEEQISAHYFYAALLEMHYGEFNRAQIISHFELEPADETGLDALIAKYQGLPADRRLEFVNWVHAVFMLAGNRAPGYTTGAELNARLGRF